MVICLDFLLHTHFLTFCTEFPNLCQYCERMKTEFWSDWDKCITHGESGQTVK